MPGDSYLSAKEKRDIAYAFIDAHPAMPEPDRMLAFAEAHNGELVKALEAIAIALQEPAGGEYWTARQFLDTQGVWHGDLNDERVLNAVAIAALKLARRKP